MKYSITYFLTCYIKAGLIQTKDSQHLMIASQSEAGICFLRNNDRWINEGWVNPKGYLTLRLGAKYLIVDSGGKY